jgi:iron complex transport system ATP-binding protein
MENQREHIIELLNLEIGYRKGRGREGCLAGPISSGACSGELIAVMGRNGSGKSTLLRTVAGLMDGLRGDVRILGRELAAFSRKELARILGYVSTEVVSVPGLSVEKLVALGRYPYTSWLGRMSSSDREVVERAIDLTSLQALRDRDLDELSDGERQRAMIARTLAQDTRILILDEPTAFLDMSHRYEIIALLGDLAKDHGKTVIYSTHDLQIALQQADKIWLIHKHEMLEGAPEDLVLSGRLSEALRQKDAGTEIEMDPQTGEFTIKRAQRADISLSSGQDVLTGPDGLETWTKKALERNRFRVTENKKAGIHIMVDMADGSPKWSLEKSGGRMAFNSIYDLSLYLRTIN